MSEAFIIRPLQANLIYDKDDVGSMDPYCVVTIGNHKGKTSIAKSEGLHPHWDEAIKLERKHEESFCYIKIMDHDTVSSDDPVGQVKICLEPVETKGTLLQWYSAYDHNRLAGEILVEIKYVPAPPVEIKPIIIQETVPPVVIQKETIVEQTVRYV